MNPSSLNLQTHKPSTTNLAMAPLSPNIISPQSPKPFTPQLFPQRFWCSSRCLTKRWTVSMPCASYHVKTESKPEFSSQHLVKSIAKGFVGFAAAATALLSICCDSPAFAESLTVAFPVSRAPEVIVLIFLFRFFKLLVYV